MIMFKEFILFCLFISFSVSFTQTRKIEILSSKISTANEEKFPGATILIGNVKIAHEGATLSCQKALYYQKENFFKAIGEVLLEQGDTITQTSKYADYDGNTKQALSWGNVNLQDPKMTLTTDTLYFDRINQKLYYKTGGKIKDSVNTLTSYTGSYYLENKKFSAISNVSVTNPKHTLKSKHLDYYTTSKLAYLYGETTITNTKNNNKLYCEKGFYDTNTEVSYFVKNAKIFLKDRTIKGDSLYYDRKKGFASANNNIKVIDTVQNLVTKANYAELYEHKDSLFLVDKPVAISIIEKDSMYVHGDTILVTGKSKKRIVRTFHNVKIFKSDLQGKCDSIHTNEQTGITKMFKNPVLWSKNSQITGDTILLIVEKKTEKLDSLKVLNNAFIIQKDTLAKDNFNQIKGRNMYGKLKKNRLSNLLVKGNAQTVYFNRNEKTYKLETITKELAGNLEFMFEKGEISQIKYIKDTEGKTYPPSKFPEEDRKLRNFIWREKEQPLSIEDLFKKDENVKSILTNKDEVIKAQKQFLDEQKLEEQLKEE